MAKAAGRSVPIGGETAVTAGREPTELAAGLDELARAQEDARGAVSVSEPNYAAAFERLFVAVARLNTLHAADAIRTLARSSIT